MDLELALIEPKPNIPNADSSTAYKVKFEKWERANRLTLMLIKLSITDSIGGSISDNGNTKNFMDAISKMFKESERTELANLTSSLMNIKYDMLVVLEILFYRRFTILRGLRN